MDAGNFESGWNQERGCIPANQLTLPGKSYLNVSVGRRGRGKDIVMVANDIKCEAQQELRTVKRKLLEEEEKNARLQKELGDLQGHSRWVTSMAAPS